MGYLAAVWQNRVVINALNSTGKASGSFDVEYVIDPTWDEFWDAIDSAGEEIRVTEADGTTLVNYNISGFNKTNRTGTVQIDGGYGGGGSNSVVIFFLYFNSTTAQGDGSSLVVITTPDDGRVDFTDPTRVEHMFTYTAQRPGSTEPAYAMAKVSNITSFVYIDLSGVLEQRESLSAGKRVFEEPYYVQISSEDTAGAAAGIEGTSHMGFLEVDNRMYLRTQIDTGTDGTNYTMVPFVGTATPGFGGGINGVRDLSLRYGVWVENVRQTAP